MGYSRAMRVLLRWLLTALVALAIPVQGIAAVRMLHCAAGHERPQATRTVAHDHAGHDAHHGAPHGADTNLAMADGHAPAPDDDHALPGGTGCSACATCCAGMGLPAAEVRLGGTAPEAPVADLRADAVPPFLTGGLDRPPRAPRS